MTIAAIARVTCLAAALLTAGGCANAPNKVAADARDERISLALARGEISPELGRTVYGVVALLSARTISKIETLKATSVRALPEGGDVYGFDLIVHGRVGKPSGLGTGEITWRPLDDCLAATVTRGRLSHIKAAPCAGAYVHDLMPYVRSLPSSAAAEPTPVTRPAPAYALREVRRAPEPAPTTGRTYDALDAALAD